MLNFGGVWLSSWDFRSLEKMMTMMMNEEEEDEWCVYYIYCYGFIIYVEMSTLWHAGLKGELVDGRARPGGGSHSWVPLSYELPGWKTSKALQVHTLTAGSPWATSCPVERLRRRCRCILSQLSPPSYELPSWKTSKALQVHTSLAEGRTVFLAEANRHRLGVERAGIVYWWEWRWEAWPSSHWKISSLLGDRRWW